MNAKIGLLFSILAILSSKYTQGQVDSTAILSLFPLHLGDTWQYMHVNESNLPFDTTYSQLIMAKDTIMPNGKRYMQYSSMTDKISEYVRVDSSELMIYRYNIFSCRNDSEEVYYDLDIKADSIEYCEFPYLFYDSTYSQVGNLPDFRMQYRYRSTHWGYYSENYLTYGYGLSKFGDYYGFGDTPSKLIAAKINDVIYGEFVTTVEQNKIIAESPKLYQNFPNPFNPNTNISFYLPKPDQVVLEVYNTIGQRVVMLINEKMNAGNHSLRFDGSNLGSGVYLYILKTKTYTDVKKMLLLK